MNTASEFWHKIIIIRQTNLQTYNWSNIWIRSSFLWLCDYFISLIQLARFTLSSYWLYIKLCKCLRNWQLSKWFQITHTQQFNFKEMFHSWWTDWCRYFDLCIINIITWNQNLSCFITIQLYINPLWFCDMILIHCDVSLLHTLLKIQYHLSHEISTYFIDIENSKYHRWKWIILKSIHW